MYVTHFVWDNRYFNEIHNSYVKQLTLALLKYSRTSITLNIVIDINKLGCWAIKATGQTDQGN